MFFFIGTHISEKDFGAEGYHTCTRCNNTGYWRLIKETTWLILMFIPIPIKVRYFSRCPFCRGTASMTKAEFEAAVKNAKPKA